MRKILIAVLIGAAIAAEGSLDTLATLTAARTRCVSPENRTGAPGGAARATPANPPVRNVSNASHAASELGRGWKVNPYVRIAPGETLTLMDTKGPGVIRHVWMTLTGDWSKSILRIYWDGEATPSVEVPAAHFFCQGWNQYAPLVSECVCVNPGSAFNCYWAMPFRRHARITMENIDAKQMTLYYYIDYEETAVGADQAYFHAQHRRTADDPTSDYTILDGVRGQGQYVGTYLAWGVHNDGWWGEGEVKFYIDEDADFPTVCSTGLEDYFCGSYNFDRKGKYAVFNTPYAGLCQVLPPEVAYKSGQKFGLYRWHVKDPVRFSKRLRVTVQDLGWKKGGLYLAQHSEIAATTFWYQTEPHAPFPASGAGAAAEGWPVLRQYEGEALRRVRMPMGGIGTGTISLSGRGSLVDWEVCNVPCKGHVPHGLKNPHFAIRCETVKGVRQARLLEGPLGLDEYEGESGSSAPNHGFPRFTKAVFKAAYPLAQIDLTDPRFPLRPHLEAFNPLVPNDADASGIPAICFRWVVTNPSAEPLKVSIVGSVVKDPNVYLTADEKAGVVTRADDVREPGWNVASDRYWRLFLNEGRVENTPKSFTTATKDVRGNLVCVSFSLKPGETRKIPFALSWRFPDRKMWGRAKENVGNWYAVRYPTAKAAADDLFARLPELEAKTVAFVRSVLAEKAPDVVKEAALFNLSTLRTETCFRTADGHFFGWEGCFNRAGSCMGSCTHVWGYEHALIDLWPKLAKDMTELQFSPACMDGRGHILNRINSAKSNEGAVSGGLAAADGQMQCIIKAYENWQKTKDDAWLRKLWPNIRKAIEFCWVKGGWDADRDGVMEGCQHNTMDVEYYGPNPQMEFLYLAALEAEERMATFCGESAFAATCRDLRLRGQAWTEKNLFNGHYYEHKIMPPKSAADIAVGLRHGGMGAKDLSNPDFQLGAGCLIDQLLGDYSARAVGLPGVADPEHERITLRTILEKCRRAPGDDAFNCMRSFVLADEESLRMAWYPEGRMPVSPFPYYTETMTGFEYVVAALLAMNGDLKEAERVVRNIRSRYDGVKRNPFDEAECGHHYARAMAAWTVLKAWNKGGRGK